MTKKQKWVLEYLKGVVCASEHELAKYYASGGTSKPSQQEAFNMHTTLDTLIERGLVKMARNPTSGFRYYSLTPQEERR